MTPRQRPEIAALVSLITDIAADDDQVLAMLALERIGHPKAQTYGDTRNDETTDRPPSANPSPWEPDEERDPLDEYHGVYPDPTGEHAIRHDPAIAYGRQYAAQLARALRALKHVDAIRRRSIPNTSGQRTPGDAPKDVCRRCFVLPRDARHRYCWRCRKQDVE